MRASNNFKKSVVLCLVLALFLSSCIEVKPHKRYYHHGHKHYWHTVY